MTLSTFVQFFSKNFLECRLPPPNPKISKMAVTISRGESSYKQALYCTATPTPPLPPTPPQSCPKTPRGRPAEHGIPPGSTHSDALYIDSKRES